MLVTLLVGMSVFMTTAVDASESFFSNPNLQDLLNGEITLTEVGHQGAGLHMSFQTPATGVPGMSSCSSQRSAETVGKFTRPLSGRWLIAGPRWESGR